MANYRGIKQIGKDCIYLIDPTNFKSYTSGTDVYNVMDSSFTGSMGGTTSSSPYFEFDGTDDHITFPHLTIDQSNFTLEFWFRYDGSGTSVFPRLINLQGKGTGLGFTVYMTSGVTFRYGDGGNKDTLFGLSGYTDGNPHHLVVTHQTGVGQSVYLDGVQNNYSTHVGTPGDNPAYDLIIGNWSSPYDRPFQGGIGLARIYNRVITADEVLTNYIGMYPRFNR